MTRHRFSPLAVMSLTTSALIGCQDTTPPTALPPTNAQLTEVSEVDTSPPVDTTPPVIAYALSGTLGQDNWYTDSAAIAWSVTDPESPVAIVEGTCISFDTGSWGQYTVDCTATSAGGTTSQTATFKIDDLGPRPLPPLFYSTPQSAPGWWNTDVSVKWYCQELDFESGAVDEWPTAIVSTEGRNQAVVGTCIDKAGNVQTTRYDDFDGVPISIDKTPPALEPTVSPNSVLLNGSATASPNATDALSGVASQSCASVITSSVGLKSVSCTATDRANNTAASSAFYTVIYAFSGFSGLNTPPALNAARAGYSTAVKFSLGGNRGLAILAGGSPASVAINCLTGAEADTALHTSTAGNLTYAKNGTYTYDWRTDKNWVGTCRQLTVGLMDGTEHLVNFRFK